MEEPTGIGGEDIEPTEQEIKAMYAMGVYHDPESWVLAGVPPEDATRWSNDCGLTAAEAVAIEDLLGADTAIGREWRKAGVTDAPDVWTLLSQGVAAVAYRAYRAVGLTRMQTLDWTSVPEGVGDKQCPAFDPAAAAAWAKEGFDPYEARLWVDEAGASPARAEAWKRALRDVATYMADDGSQREDSYLGDVGYSVVEAGYAARGAGMLWPPLLDNRVPHDVEDAIVCGRLDECEW